MVLATKGSKCGSLFRDPPQFVYSKGKSIASQVVKSDIKPKKRAQQAFLCTHQREMFPLPGMPELFLRDYRGEYTPPTKWKRNTGKGLFFFTSNSNNVIYLLKCLCGITYIGQTLRAIKHCSKIRLYKNRMGKLKSELQMNENVAEVGTKLGDKHFYEVTNDTEQILTYRYYKEKYFRLLPQKPLHQRCFCKLIVDLDLGILHSK